MTKQGPRIKGKRPGGEEKTRRREDNRCVRNLTPDVDWRAALERFIDELRQVYGLRLRGVFLYGSRARGDATSESDIDTLVLLEPCQDFWAEFNLISPVASRVSLNHDVVISAIPVDAARFAVDDRPVIVNARREGRLIT